MKLSRHLGDSVSQSAEGRLETLHVAICELILRLDHVRIGLQHLFAEATEHLGVLFLCLGRLEEGFLHCHELWLHFSGRLHLLPANGEDEEEQSSEGCYFFEVRCRESRNGITLKQEVEEEGL